MAWLASGGLRAEVCSHGISGPVPQTARSSGTVPAPGGRGVIRGTSRTPGCRSPAGRDSRGRRGTRGTPPGRLVGHLERRQHAPEVGAVVAVVEQADVPAAAERLEELHQRAGPLGELEAARPLVPRVAGAAADHVAHVQLRQLVLREVERLVAGARCRRSATATRVAAATSVLTPTKMCAALAAAQAVVELGDHAAAERGAELAERARAARGSSRRRAPRAPRRARRARRRSAGDRSSCSRRSAPPPAAARRARARARRPTPSARRPPARRPAP